MVANLREDLAGGGREVLETHISLVFRGERDVIKVKKPVSLGFVDYSTPRRRRHACEDEVRLNSRLAPGVYLGVEAITRSSDGAYRLGGSGAPVDWAVRMKRLQDRCRADLRLVAGTLEEPWLHSLAGRLARFHGEAPRRTERFLPRSPGGRTRDDPGKLRRRAREHRPIRVGATGA